VYLRGLTAEGADLHQSLAITRHPPAQRLATSGEEQHLTWGINAVVLKSPWAGAPSLNDLLADQGHALILNRFYRAGGDNRPATPTECRIAYDSNTLFVALRCEEKDLSFPVGRQKRDWYATHTLPIGAESCPPFPDKVDLLIRPDMGSPSCYQFAATLEGLKFGCELSLSSNPEKTDDEHARDSVAVNKVVEAFDATVTKGTDGWTVFFQIPWETLGGKPQSHFGFLPMRTRWRDGEFTSPVAIDFDECMPVDLLIETHFSGTAEVQEPENSLCQLPSGLFRWQRPAVLTYPDRDALQQIWRMQTLLTTPTDAKNLAQRLYLTQRWMDLMTLEGFTPLPRAWGVLPVDLTLAYLRQRINAAFQKNDSARAYQTLDTYLSHLSKMSEWWYADGSPGDIRKDEWHPITTAESLEVSGNLLRMRCKAGDHGINLHLALPKTGGVRIFTADEGHIKPADLLPLKVMRSSSSWSIETADGRVTIRREPFSISFNDAAGDPVLQIGADDLAFRFSPESRVLATDFKNRLDPSEVIYGFGEKYDHFDHNGNVLTLWGTDDWVGNGMGLRNTTYKPLPIFHSSKGYMVFGNSSYRLRADVGRTDSSRYRLSQHGPIFDYYFWIGSPEKALQSYTALTGRPILPPRWAFEPWMGRGGEAWAHGLLHDAVAEEESAARRFAELDVPHSAIYAEGPSALSPALNEFMGARGIKVLGYFHPAIPPSQQKSLMPELKPDELPILHCESEHEPYVDFTNPHAEELCRRALKEALDLGVAGSMVDYGDMVPDGAVFCDGKRGDEMHNCYYRDYQRTVSEVFSEKRGNDFVLYARGAAPGTQKWVGQFAGDHPANFDGLKAVVTGALNLCACGYSNWGSDIGGYFGTPEPAVYMRWVQFGCFSPLMRPHGTAPREPWYYGEAAVASYKFDAWVRESLLNYIYNAAVVAHESGIPIMRSMAVAFPDEQRLAAVRDQYLFGPDLLVAPVVTEDTIRTISFPSGVWTSLWNGKTISGPAELKINVPLAEIPVYLKPGAVVPVQLSRELQFGQSMTGDRVSALVVTPSNKNETVSLLNAQDEAAKVTLQCKGNGQGWILDNLTETNYLLVYGTADASRVKVDGKLLTKLTATKFNSMPTGWKADPSGNRLIIRLSAQAPPPALRREIEVEFSPTIS
jgi:alpha-glucosidase (family GH31 glycosyl hydrolase)